MITLIIVIIVFAVLFLIFREVVCWYWKINQRVQLLEEMKGLFTQIRNKVGAEVKQVSPAQEKHDDSGRYVIPEVK
jgi:hypothetical protein